MLESIVVGFLVTSTLVFLYSCFVFGVSGSWIWLRRRVRLALYRAENRHGATIVPPPSRRRRSRSWTPEVGALRWSSIPMLNDQQTDRAATVPLTEDDLDTLTSNELDIEVDFDTADTIPCPAREA